MPAGRPRPASRPRRKEAAVTLFDAVRAAALQVRQLERQRRRDARGDGDRATARAWQSLATAQGSPVYLGRVVDGLPYAHWYRVLPELGLPVLPCCDLVAGGQGPSGPRGLAGVGLGSLVVFVLHPDRAHGIILGAVPEPSTSAQDCGADFVSTFGRAGLRHDPAHQAFLLLPGLGDAADYSAGRPLDALATGEAGSMAPTGTGVFHDDEMAVVRAGGARVVAYQYDDLLRLEAINFERRDAGGVQRRVDDEGELGHEEHHAVYPWETLGAYRPGTAPLRELDAGAAVRSGRQPLEPVHDDQDGFYRVGHYAGGYLGQGGRRQLALPPADAADVPLNRLGPGVLPGAFLEQTQLTGRHLVATAHSLLLAKRLPQPVPKRVRRAEDAGGGDRPINYRFSGLSGQGPPHLVTDDVRADGGGVLTKGELAGAASADRHSHAFNWEARLPFHYHLNDWFVPDESAAAFGGLVQAAVDFGALADQAALEPPAARAAHVDHRYGEVDYIPNYSFFELNRFGGVQQQDGWFTAVRSSGGNLELCPAGDLVLRPGRDLVVVVGRDLVARVRRAADLSVTEESLRLRAGDKLLLKAEDVEAYADRDLQLKAGKAARLWAKDVYVRAGAPSDPTGQAAAEAGGIHFDAGRGEGVISMHANTVERFLTSAALDFFGTRGAITAANSYSARGAVIVGNTVLTGCVVVGDNLFVDQWLVSVNCHVATAQTSSYQRLVGNLQAGDLTRARASLASAEAMAASARTAGTEAYSRIYGQCLYADGADGDDGAIKAAKFRYRDDDAYGPNVYLVEAPWQQQARLAGGAGADRTWVEEPEDETYPHPGKSAFESDGLVQVDLRLYNAATGKSRPAPADGGDYADPAYEAPERVGLDNNYYVIR
jgi:hypothetical protein